MRLILVKEILFTGSVILILHLLALKLFLYWTIDWFDILMHLLGGLLIGFIMISFMKRIHTETVIINKRLLTTAVILGVLVVGLAWELWELFVGLSDVIEDKLDVTIDLVMDLMGAIMAVFYNYFKTGE